MGVVIGRDFEDVVLLIAFELPRTVAQNAASQRLVQIHLTLVLRPVALEAEALVQAWRQHEHPLFIAEHDLCDVLLCIRECDPVERRVLIPNFHLVLLRLVTRIKRHRA
ncbi:hypothetical protein D3C81_1008930 [compost metagenome]